MAIGERLGKFGAKLEINREQVWLGTFKTRPEAEEAQESVRGAIKRGEVDKTTARLWLRVVSNAGGFIDVLAADPCAYCGGPGGVIDHIHPRVAGGPDEWENFTGACQRCNSQKHDRSLLGFLGWRAERRAAEEHRANAALWTDVALGRRSVEQVGAEAA